MSDSFEQRTLRHAASCRGVGLHSGNPVAMRLLPAPADTGIAFVRVDLPGRPVIPARAENVVETALATTLGVGQARVGTVEHLLSALAGLGVDNVRVELDGPEVPILDGSAAPFADLISQAGLRTQSVAKRFVIIRKAVRVTDGDKFAQIAPSKSFRIDCTIDFKHPLISDQSFCLEFSEGTYAREIARARTFGFLRDVEKLKAMGLARGGSLANAIVVDDFSILNPEGLRYADEFVRHKLLDTIGDISLLGMPMLGHLTVFKSGHALNNRLVRAVAADASAYDVVRASAGVIEKFELSAGALSGVLAPHAT
jgi:UDP-3-O-[3-hydroxymyristoyl] N-acetylglucosamine deacetylase